tara:strand:+ start:64 stop:1542 length:1479 start_codon:yes stop_codon:yes gene_type:complete
MTTYTKHFLKTINSTSNTKELLTTAYNNHPSVTEFELCWTRIMGDEPVRELVERIMFFAGGMGNPANNELSDFIENFNFKTIYMRQDLFYEYSGSARNIKYVGNYCCEDNYETLLSHESGNARNLMIQLGKAESEIDQTKISQNIDDLSVSFLRLNLNHYHNHWKDKDFMNAVNEFNKLNDSEYEKTIKFASWRTIKKDADLEYERINLIVRYMIFYMIYKIVYGMEWKENMVDIIELFNGVYKIWEVRETNYFSIRQIETNIHKAMVKYDLSKDMLKWDMITRGKRNEYSDTGSMAFKFNALVDKLEKRCWVLNSLEWISNDTEDNYFRKNATSIGVRGYFNLSTKDDIICIIEKYNHNIRDVELDLGTLNDEGKVNREIKYNKSWDKKRLVQAWMSEGETERRHEWKIQFNKVIKLLSKKEIKMSSYKKFRKWVVWNKDGSIHYKTFIGRNSMWLVNPVNIHELGLVFKLRNKTKNKIEYTNDKNYMSEN